MRNNQNVTNAKKLVNAARAVIFDADGLLIDSEPFWGKAKQQMLDKRGIGHKNFNTGTVGMGLREAVIVHKRTFGYTETIEELMQEYREELYAFLYAQENLLMPGAKELVKKLKSDGIVDQVRNDMFSKKIAVATGGHNPQELQLLLNKFAIGDLFDVIASCEEVERGKPFPDVYLYTAKKLDVNPKDCVVLEDSANGTKAGKAAGMIVIGVNNSEKGKKELEVAGADVTIDSLKNIC